MIQELVIGLEDIPKVVDELYTSMDQCKVFTFEGPLGAGKTTVIRELLLKCGVIEPVTSPTFTYVNVYKNSLGQIFYHFDLYRLQTLDDFLQAGFDEYLYQPNSWAFIEWPEIIRPLLEKQVCNVTIDYEMDGRRLLKINKGQHHKKSYQHCL